MGADAAKHVVPAGSDGARRQTLLDLIASAHDVIPVANATERATVLAGLVAAGRNPATAPVYVDQLDVGVVLRNVTTSDANWTTVAWPRINGSWGLPSAEPIANGAFTVVTATTAVGAIDAGLSNAGGAITIAAAGLYRVSARALWPLGVAGHRYGLHAALNCTSIDGSGNLSAGGVLVGENTTILAVAVQPTTNLVSAPFAASAGDVLRVFAFHDQGSTINLLTGSSGNYLGVTSVNVQRVG